MARTREPSGPFSDTPAGRKTARVSRLELLPAQAADAPFRGGSRNGKESSCGRDDWVAIPESCRGGGQRPSRLGVPEQLGGRLQEETCVSREPVVVVPDMLLSGRISNPGQQPPPSSPRPPQQQAVARVSLAGPASAHFDWPLCLPAPVLRSPPPPFCR